MWETGTLPAFYESEEKKRVAIIDSKIKARDERIAALEAQLNPSTADTTDIDGQGLLHYFLLSV